MCIQSNIFFWWWWLLHGLWTIKYFCVCKGVCVCVWGCIEGCVCRCECGCACVRACKCVRVCVCVGERECVSWVENAGDWIVYFLTHFRHMGVSACDLPTPIYGLSSISVSLNLLLAILIAFSSWYNYTSAATERTLYTQFMPSSYSVCWNLSAGDSARVTFVSPQGERLLTMWSAWPNG